MSYSVISTIIAVVTISLITIPILGFIVGGLIGIEKKVMIGMAIMLSVGTLMFIFSLVAFAVMDSYYCYPDEYDIVTMENNLDIFDVRKQNINEIGTSYYTHNLKTGDRYLVIDYLPLLDSFRIIEYELVGDRKKSPDITEDVFSKILLDNYKLSR